MLEPIAQLKARGFEVTEIYPDERGWVDPRAIETEVRPDTLLVSVMQVNNETGVIQPIDEIADLLSSSDAYLHVDAAQGFTKVRSIVGLTRVDLASISAHKIGGPMGIGALIARSRRSKRSPLRPLVFGGGQEKGIRPGTLPVHLIAALGEAAQLGTKEFEVRQTRTQSFKNELKAAFEVLSPHYIGDQKHCVPNIVSLSIDGVDSEAFMLATKDYIAVSNGSACTSDRYEPSHVLTAMGVDAVVRAGAVRMSWSHDTETPDWSSVVACLEQLR